MTLSSQSTGSELSWLLDDLVHRVAQIRKAVILTQDGLAVAASRGLAQEDTEHLAALAAGFQSLARGAGRHFGGGQVRQTIIEMDAGFLFVSAAGQGTCLAVLSAANADVGLIAYEMAVLIRRSSEHLTAAQRPVPAAPGPVPPPPWEPRAAQAAQHGGPVPDGKRGGPIADGEHGESMPAAGRVPSPRTE